MKTLVLIIAFVATGCSWIMVAGPPPISQGPPGMMSRQPPLHCTREKFAPIVDTVFASMFALGTAVAVPIGVVVSTSSDDWNRMYGAIMIGVGLLYAAMAAPLFLSARSGFRDVSNCRAAHEMRDPP